MEQPNLKYPKSVNVNFRKLSKGSLTKVLKHYQVDVRKDVTQNDLAVMVARVFEASSVLEESVIDKFSSKHSFQQDSVSHTNETTAASRKRTYSSREALDREPAQPGEQVAAKVSKANEDGSWILGNVLDYDPRSQIYAVQDEDDDSASHLRRGDLVLAVFPETTSFYRAVVAKSPKAPSNPNGAWDVVVRFDDDEDETGKNPARRVPARFVLPRAIVDEHSYGDENPSKR